MPKYKNLFDKKHEYLRYTKFKELGGVFEELFGELREGGFHPREIYLLALDALNSKATLNRDLARYDE